MDIKTELIRVAKNLVAFDFPNKKTYDKYMKDHPAANRANHRIVENAKKTVHNPPTKGKSVFTGMKGKEAIDALKRADKESHFMADGISMDYNDALQEAQLGAIIRIVPPNTRK